MDNATKQYLATLEYRIMKLEKVVKGFEHGLNDAVNFRPTCNMCDAYDPIDSGYKCDRADCIQGCGPEVA